MDWLQPVVDVGTGIAGIIGNRKDKLAAENAANKSWQRNYEAQKEFAQNSIQWRVQDAKLAGVNPYAAIGGQTPGYTPQDSSYTTNYQGAISQAGNRLSDALGQLQMANLRADVKGKQLDNDKKAIELINKAFEAGLGQTSATLRDPSNKTHTNPVQGVGGLDHVTLPSGEQVAVPKNGAEIDDPSAVMQLLNAWFHPAYTDNLIRANKGKGQSAFTWSGYRFFPHGVEPDKVNSRADKVARRFGSLAAWLSLPFAHVGFGINDALKSWLKRDISDAEWKKRWDYSQKHRRQIYERR